MPAFAALLAVLLAQERVGRAQLARLGLQLGQRGQLRLQQSRQLVRALRRQREADLVDLAILVHGGLRP
ncbi:hypothetical protein [Duganella sp. BJB1802]|uniref:hypothetical protein n=1 Tax=Duganella sp. BJB1802 TaxID=2744575 RepID=UPI001E376BF4|nr:hypothetical protein [Duganella sp. BJB1802]